MSKAIIVLSKKGYEIANKIACQIDADIFMPKKLELKPCLPAGRTKELKTEVFDFPLSQLIENIFNKYDSLIFIMALGIVVREIASLLKNKSSDPAVITINETGKFVVSTIGGHEAGANKLAKEIAAMINAEPVITTASNSSKIVIGVGLKKNKSKEEIIGAIYDALDFKNIPISNISQIATIEIKKDDSALSNACQELSLPLVFVSRKEIDTLDVKYSSSYFVKEKIGVNGVCEPAALIVSENKQIVMNKTAYNGITIAMAR